MEPLIPPDRRKCQAESVQYRVLNTPNPTYLLARCGAVPRWIATEKEPGEDGRRGSMSLCGACRQMVLTRAAAGEIPLPLFEKIPKKK